MLSPTKAQYLLYRAIAGALTKRLPGVTISVSHFAHVQATEDGAFVECQVWVPASELVPAPGTYHLPSCYWDADATAYDCTEGCEIKRLNDLPRPTPQT